jgi:hypothetical protein
LVLSLQGLLPFGFPSVPYVNMLLFGAAIILLFGISITTYFAVKE